MSAPPEDQDHEEDQDKKIKAEAASKSTSDEAAETEFVNAQPARAMPSSSHWHNGSSAEASTNPQQDAMLSDIVKGDFPCPISMHDMRQESA